MKLKQKSYEKLKQDIRECRILMLTYGIFFFLATMISFFGIAKNVYEIIVFGIVGMLISLFEIIIIAILISESQTILEIRQQNKLLYKILKQGENKE